MICTLSSFGWQVTPTKKILNGVAYRIEWEDKITYYNANYDEIFNGPVNDIIYIRSVSVTKQIKNITIINDKLVFANITVVDNAIFIGGEIYYMISDFEDDSFFINYRTAQDVIVTDHRLEYCRIEYIIKDKKVFFNDKYISIKSIGKITSLYCCEGVYFMRDDFRRFYEIESYSTIKPRYTKAALRTEYIDDDGEFCDSLN